MTFIVPQRILDQVGRHSDQARWDREICGVLGADADGVVVRYVRVRNRTKTSLSFVVAVEDVRRAEEQMPGLTHIPLHSHPSGSPNPSRRDLDGASLAWLESPYAIYHVGTSSIHIHQLKMDRSAFAIYGSDDWQTPER